jgi:hypothetical protein
MMIFFLVKKKNQCIKFVHLTSNLKMKKLKNNNKEKKKKKGTRGWRWAQAHLGLVQLHLDSGPDSLSFYNKDKL